MLFLFLNLGIGVTAQNNLSEDYDEVSFQNDRQIINQIQVAANEIIKRKNVLSPQEAAKQLESTSNMKITISNSNAGVTTLSNAKIFKKIKNATVIFIIAFDCGSCDRTHVTVSSGYIIGDKGICVTNSHVVESYSNAPKKNLAMFIQTSDGENYPVIEVLSSSETNDLAILRLDTNEKILPFLPLGNLAEVGTKVFALSHPDNMFYYFSEGIVARNYMDRRTQKHRMAITADYARGSSGGPIVDKYGNLVGTITSSQSIYYGAKEQSNLQMVIKKTIPIIALKRLLNNTN